MRLKLSLVSRDKFFPLNYNYFLSSAIYKLLRFGSPEFADFLHNKGFRLNDKPYKLFTFALRFQNCKIGQNNFHLNLPNVTLFISSPLTEEFIKNFVIGTFENHFIEIASGDYQIRLAVEHIESLPEPVIKDICYIRMLSPMVLSTVEEESGVRKQHFLRYNEDISEINRVFNQNLKNKYKIVYNKDYIGEDLDLVWDNDYMAKKLAERKRLTKKISILKNNMPPVEIIANEVPFTLTGNSELIRVGYESGFGEKNSMGFGMGEVI